MSCKTLIALIDASNYAQSVCDHAAWAAGRMGARVKLYHVMGRRESMANQDLSGAIELGARTHILEKLAEVDAARAKLSHELGRTILDDAKTRVIEASARGGTGAVEVETRLRQGDLIETITAKQATGDMIMLGKRGEAAALAMAHIGSNLERIARAVLKPVFIASRAFKPISSVLVAFDGGASAQKIIEYIKTNPLFSGLNITLVHVGAPTTAMTQSLEKAVVELRNSGVGAVSFTQRSGTPETVLAQMSNNEGHDLLVMGTYGHSRIRSLIIGSTTTQMIASCHVPLVLVR